MPAFTTFTDPGGRPGISISDPVENARFAFICDRTVTPTSRDDVDWLFPVESTAEITTTQVRVPKRTAIYVRAPDATETKAAFTPDDGDPVELSDGRWLYEVNTAPMKLYLQADGGCEIRLSDDGSETVLDFTTETAVQIGARSFRDSPAGTITVPDDPEAVMDAVSLFGSALQTTSPERSWPTLRGHPPLLEAGDTFSAPSGLSAPETGVTVEVPPEYEYIYPVASLAYYLGADVAASDHPRLVTDEGFTYDLAREPGFEQTVSRVLRQVFVLDCVTRTEGYYDIALAERSALEPRLDDADFASWYDMPPAGRLETYLDISWDVVEGIVPEWTLTVDIDTEIDYCEALPYAANDLAVLRAVDQTPEPVAMPSDDFDEFARSSRETFERAVEGDESLFRERLYTPESATSVGHEYAGGSIAVGAGQLLPDACRRNLERSPREDLGIEVEVVVNDAQMDEEGVVSDCYCGFYDLFVEFETTIHEGLSTQELRELLAGDVDFLHFIGHVDERGLQCTDGWLDVRTMTEVNVDAFVLNACTSYVQGEALVERGSLAGIATMTDIRNATAVEVGHALARLLNAGFNLRTAMEIARQETQEGFRWLALGDCGLALCEPASATPLHLEVERVGADAFRTTVRAYTCSQGVGSVFNVHLPGVDEQHLIPGVVDTVELSGEELDEFLNEERMPVEVDGRLEWSQEVTTAEF